MVSFFRPACLGAGVILGAFIYALLSELVFPQGAAAVFSPDGSSAIVSMINGARGTLDVEMYVFTSDEVADALRLAHERGVRVRVILEKRVGSNENDRMYAKLNGYGIETRWASEAYTLTHSKFVIADGSTVYVGSHNFSNNALRSNREAGVILQGPATGDFRRTFENDWALAG